MRTDSPARERAHVGLGFEVGSGTPVEVPLAHTFVTGQTQLSGKTTTLRAIVERSGRRALAFVTKRGEEFAGRRVPPYLPRTGDRQLHWRLVETLMAAALGQRNMKWERGAIVTATKGATSLDGVRENVRRLRAKTKNPKTEELYMLLGEYLDLVLPELDALQASSTLVLGAGLNVMDLAGVGAQTQAWVIRAALEQINHHEREVLTVFPEAWEFAPRGRSAPAKDEAIAMARKGAVLGNFLLCDSQDLAGVDTVLRQATSVWILGVQRELNELKRTLDSIPAGIAKPKSADIATLELGQFFACWGRHVVKTYVQPPWLADGFAQRVALGELRIDQARRQNVKEARTVTNDEAASLREDNERLRLENANLRRRVEALERGADAISTRDREIDRAGDSGRGADARNRAGAAEAYAEPVDDDGRGAGAGSTRAAQTEGNGQVVDEATYQAIKARLLTELPREPVFVRVLQDYPELEVKRTRRTIEVDGATLKGRLAGLIAEGFFDQPKKGYAAFMELQRLGAKVAKPGVYNMCDQFAKDGFLTKEGDGYQAVAGMKVNIVEA